MKKRAILTAIFISVFLLSSITLFAKSEISLEPHNADAMWVEPASTTFDYAGNGTIGHLFNITVWLNMTENIFSYQVKLFFNATQLNCTKAGYTSTATSNYFKTHSTSSPPPVIDRIGGSILAFETCLGNDFVAGPRNASLMWAEFAILINSTSGNLTSKFDISTSYPSDTWVADPDLNNINITPYDGNYLFIGPQGPPPPLPPVSVSIAPLSSTIHLGQTVHFTSTVSGGTQPYSFQWFLNGTSVPGATLNNWNFTPTSVELDVVYLKVTDHDGNTTNSNNASVNVTPPPGGTRIYVDPPEIINLTMGPSNTFNINVTLGNATDLKQCTFNLTYIPTVINWIGIELFRVQGQYPIASVILDGNAGFIWVSLNYPSPFSTDPPAPIVRMHFHVEAYGISPINLTDTQLLDSAGHPITHDEFDGLFSNIIRDVAVTNVVPATNWIYQGWLDDINVTVKNLGNVSETFTVSAYYNGSLIGSAPITNLASNAEITTTITWNTTGVPEGNYTITGVASIVPYESNMTNNMYVDGIVQVVTIIHDVAITNVIRGSTWAYRGNPVKINVTAANLGNVSENFTVTAFADNDTIGTFPVSNLASNSTLTITFVWNTTSAQLCHNYTIRGEASLIPHEYNVTNNVYFDGTVTIRIMGDVNGDGKIDGKDITIIAKAFGSYGPNKLFPGSPPSPTWNPDADLNLDNVVDGRDLVLAARHFGEFCA